ncbi:hypothetical protein C8R44DRAFT_740914 [Mycena epipterygia]|nr:hypothetical protein C8R44DRAFT_740914 [Mycena epipterygia]
MRLGRPGQAVGLAQRVAIAYSDQPPQHPCDGVCDLAVAAATWVWAQEAVGRNVRWEAEEIWRVHDVAVFVGRTLRHGTSATLGTVAVVAGILPYAPTTTWQWVKLNFKFGCATRGYAGGEYATPLQWRRFQYHGVPGRQPSIHLDASSHLGVKEWVIHAPISTLTPPWVP